MKSLLYVFATTVGITALLIGGWYTISPPKEVKISDLGLLDKIQPKKPVRTKEELIADALERSKEIKGLYMTADVASDKGAGATRLRNELIHLADTTEINGLVIDVKEVCGPDYNEANLKELLDTLHQKNIWAIARIVTFKDASQVEVHPDWYLQRSSPKSAPDPCLRKKHLLIKSPDGKKPESSLWRDNSGGYWMDPASRGAREYVVGLAKKMIDMGFDEIQFDYVRFPSDGDVQIAKYPSWDGKTPKYVVMKDFFQFVNKNLKAYKPDIILSADLFGYASIRAGDVGIGQRLDDVGDNFDYVSFMVYPSHYYSGLYLPGDPSRNLAAVNLNKTQVRVHPDIVVGRSELAARDFLDGRDGTSTTATTTLVSRSRVRLRPWLEDFFHEADQAAGRPYGTQKVRLQVDAVEKVEKHGWLLWSAANVYSEGALTRQ